MLLFVCSAAVESKFVKLESKAYNDTSPNGDCSLELVNWEFKTKLKLINLTILPKTDQELF